MQVQTRTGPTTLRPTDIQHGMVFRDPADSEPNIFKALTHLYADREAGMREVAEALAADVTAGKIAFLGCDPREAARTLCEHYGLPAEMDATQYGFARLREGGALDLYNPRNLRPGMVFQHKATGERLTVPAKMTTEQVRTWRESGARWQFVDVDPVFTNPLNIQELCCGAEHVGLPRNMGKRTLCTLPLGHPTSQHHHDYLTKNHWHVGGDLAADKVWSSGKASGLCPHCKKGHMEQRTTPKEGTFMVCVDGCGRSAHVIPMAGPLADGAGRSPKGKTWPFQHTSARFRFEAGTTSRACTGHFNAAHHDMRLSFANVPAGADLFALRDMFTCNARVRFTLHHDDGTSARFEVTPNDVATSTNPRLRDASDIDAHVTHVKRVETADEYWSQPKEKADPIKDIRAAVRVYAHPKGNTAHEDMAAVKDALEKLASPGAIVCGPLSVWKDAIPKYPTTLPAAIAQAIANAPPAVDVGRWTRVVHVLAADIVEDKSPPQRVPTTLAAVTEAIVAYATLRFVHRYDAKEAVRRATEKGNAFPPKKLERFFAAYEAGA